MILSSFILISGMCFVPVGIENRAIDNISGEPNTMEWLYAAKLGGNRATCLSKVQRRTAYRLFDVF